MYRLLAIGLLLCAAQFCAANTALWEVSNGKQVLWLGASLGALKDSAYPLPAEFDDAFRRADKLYVERDVAAVSQPDFAMRAMQTSVYADGRTLKTVLSTDAWQALDEFTRKRDIPSFSLLMFKPAFAGFTLAALEGKRLSLENGVDAHYFYRAKKLNKPVATLETLDQQIALLQKVNTLDGDLLIGITLQELEQLSTTLNQVTAAWRAGDMAKLDKLKGKELRSEAPGLYQILVAERNAAWLPSFKKMLNSEEKALVLVDVTQFTGPQSLLMLLRKAGYHVKPYTLTQ